MLPHYVEQRFFRRAGGPRRRSAFRWTAPGSTRISSSGFPQIGEINVRGMNVELRHALEPWHVLGEDQMPPAAPSATSTVPPSASRCARGRMGGGALPARPANGVGGAAVGAPSTSGDYVGGVRFKAWQPPSALHPSIHAQAPLVFDVHDRWTGRSLGGMTHEVSHPGGRSYETFPVNANEAEARRRARFFRSVTAPVGWSSRLSVAGWRRRARSISGVSRSPRVPAGARADLIEGSSLQPSHTYP